MFQLTDKYFKLIDYYSEMAKNGYNNKYGKFISEGYGTAEPIKFKDEIRTLVNHFQCKTALDYGSGESNLNIKEISNGMTFKDYVGLGKIYQFEPAKKLIQKGSLI